MVKKKASKKLKARIVKAKPTNKKEHKGKAMFGLMKVPKAMHSRERNLDAALAYSIPVLGGLLAHYHNPDDDLVKFHSAQSVAWGVAIVIVSYVLMITIIGAFLLPLWWLVALLSWVMLMLKAYNGEYYALPVVGKYAQEAIE